MKFKGTSNWESEICSPNLSKKKLKHFFRMKENNTDFYSIIVILYGCKCSALLSKMKRNLMATGYGGTKWCLEWYEMNILTNDEVLEKRRKKATWH